MTTHYGTAGLASECDAVASAAEGSRNHRLNASAFAAGQLIAGGELDQGDAVAGLIRAAKQCGLGEHESIKTIESGLRAGRAAPRSAPERPRPDVPPPPSDGPASPDARRFMFARTDLGNSERFVQDHGAVLRYCYPWQAWLQWDGARWLRDDGAEVAKLAAATTRRMGRDAFGIADEADRAAAVKWALASQSLARLRAMVEGAQHMRTVVPDELDANPWILGTPTGTVDLRTGRLRPSRQDDLITRCTGAEYDPEAEAPGWLAFLARTFGGDGDLIDYVQRAAGYSLTGTIGEQELFLCTGSGANGKSALLGVLARVLGTYSLAAGFDLFVADRHGRNKGPGLATLDGPRLMTASEPNPGAPLDEALIKSVTGGDVVVAERKYEAPYQFTPRCKLWLACNAPPAWRHGGPSLARRVRVIPFRVVIPKGEQDPDLPARLARDEGAGILAWAVRGCLAWQREGLKPPASVLAAGEDYERDADPIAAWMELRLQRAVGYSLTLKEVHEDYSEHATSCGLRPVSSRTLATLLDARGWQRRKAKQGQIVEDCAFAPKEAM